MQTLVARPLLAVATATSKLRLEEALVVLSEHRRLHESEA